MTSQDTRQLQGQTRLDDVAHAVAEVAAGRPVVVVDEIGRAHV